MIDLINTFCIEEYPDCFIPFNYNSEAINLRRKGKIPATPDLELIEFIKSCKENILEIIVFI